MKSIPDSIYDIRQFIQFQLIHQTRIFVQYYFKRRIKSPVFIVGEPRTGSSLLESYLNSVPHISFLGEILRDLHFFSESGVYRYVVHSINSASQTICGAKLFPSQLQKHRAGLSGVKKHIPNARFILVYRKSLLDQFLSLRIAQITNHYRYQEDFKLPPFIHVDPSELFEFCRKIKKIYNGLFNEAWLKDCSIAVSYEELTADPQKVFDELIFPFLGLVSFPISTKMQKQNTKRPEEIIVNFDQIEPLLSEPWIRQEYPSEPEINLFATSGKIG